MEIFILIALFSLMVNVWLGCKVYIYKIEPPNTEYREIEVIKKAMCECEHALAYHGPKGCKQEMIKLEGITMNKTFTCPCVKYVGPEPITDLFDVQMRELETKRV